MALTSATFSWPDLPGQHDSAQNGNATALVAAEDVLDATSAAGTSEDEKRMEAIEAAPVRALGARQLTSGPLITRLASWCRKHSKGNVKPTLAVVYFDTGADSRLYYHYKVIVAAKVGVTVTGHKLLPDSTIDEVLDAIHSLNTSSSAHGILIQRPVPPHLSEEEVMSSVIPTKHVEETVRGKASNIALDALTRVLHLYGKAWMLKLNVLLLGGLNIITPQFKAELAQRYQNVQCIENLDDVNVQRLKPNHDTVIITELNKGGIIKADMLGPAIKLVVDLGFDGVSKLGDLDPDVMDVEGLLVVPTPHGVMPVLLWIMMERTILARNDAAAVRSSWSLPNCGIGCAVS